jgi:hypothetical protein
MTHAVNDEALELAEACEQYKRDRWNALTPDSRRFVYCIPQGLDLLRLQWERDYYRDRLLQMLQQTNGE